MGCVGGAASNFGVAENTNRWRDQYNWDAGVNYALCVFSIALAIAAIILKMMGH